MRMLHSRCIRMFTVSWVPNSHCEIHTKSCDRLVPLGPCWPKRYQSITLLGRPVPVTVVSAMYVPTSARASTHARARTHTHTHTGQGEDFASMIDLAVLIRVWNPKYGSYTYFGLDHAASCWLNQANHGAPHNAQTGSTQVPSSLPPSLPFLPPLPPFPPSLLPSLPHSLPPFATH